MRSPLAPSPPTPSQTIGPFFHDALIPGEGRGLAIDPAAGDSAIVLEGQVLDAAGVGVADAMVELWHPHAQLADGPADGAGWARSGTDGTGTYRLTTAAPTSLPHSEGVRQAPHVVLLVFARGLLDQLLTRAYPVGPAVAEPPDDPVLAGVPTTRRVTLLAPRDGEVDGHPRHRFDIRLQGPGETVFFRV